MSGYNPTRKPLNSLQSMFNLGNQPKVPGQCKNNLRFIDQDSSNPRNRYRLRRAFGNQLLNLNRKYNNDFIVFTNDASNSFTIRAFSNSLSQNNASRNNGDWDTGVLVNQNTQISQFNRSSTEFVFTVPQEFDLSANNFIFDLSDNFSDASFGEFIKNKYKITSAFNGSNSDINDLKNANKVTIVNLSNNDPPSRSEHIIENTNTNNHYIIDENNNDLTISISDDTGEFRSGLTPFRKAFNAGDMLTRNNSATSTLLPKPPNQVNSLRNMFGWQNNAGSVRRDSNGSFYSGNPRFVYDGSDYSRFKKLQAINRNYNDITFGGDQHSASQQAYRRVVNR